MKKKRISSHFYTSRRLGSWNENSAPGLFAQGIYPTRLYPDDLPSHYVRISRYGDIYLDTKNVRYIEYLPRYMFDDHLFKDDALYISYNKPITVRTVRNTNWFEDYDFLLWGWDMVRFICAVSANSDFDTLPIQKMLCDKFDWYTERNPDVNLGSDIRSYFQQKHYP